MFDLPPKLTFALRKVVESRGTLVAVQAGVVGFARTLTSSNLAHFITSSVVVAIARLAHWEPVVTAATSVLGEMEGR